MRILLFFTAVLLVCSCSDTPTQTAAKAPEKPVEPITGRQAFQNTYPSARMWAADAQPLRIRSMPLDEIKAEGGKSGAWAITFASTQRAAARVYTWSAIEAEGNLHQGVFGSSEDAWDPTHGPQTAFVAAALKIDTPDALKAASVKAAEYLKKPGEKPPVNFMLEETSRFPDPTWRVFWGTNPASAELTVFVDASTGVALSVVR